MVGSEKKKEKLDVFNSEFMKKTADEADDFARREARYSKSIVSYREARDSYLILAGFDEGRKMRKVE